MRKMKIYITEKRGREEMLFRFFFGLQQIMEKPYYCIAVAFMVFIFAIAWRYREWFLPYTLLPVFQYGINFLLVFAFVVLLLVVIRTVGEKAAKKDESSLVVAFTAEDLRYGYPILISRKKSRLSNNVTIKEFYTTIPKKRWEEMTEEIEDCMNVHLVPPFMEYGGKNRDNGRRIILYTAKGRMPKERGIMYDGEF